MSTNILQCEFFNPSGTEKPIHTSKTIVGIDVGVKKFATLSNGQVYQPINSFKILSQKLARA